MNGLPEVMVNFVTSSYRPELLKFLVDKISAFPEVVGIYVFQLLFSYDYTLFLLKILNYSSTSTTNLSFYKSWS